MDPDMPILEYNGYLLLEEYKQIELDLEEEQEEQEEE